MGENTVCGSSNRTCKMEIDMAQTRSGAGRGEDVAAAGPVALVAEAARATCRLQAASGSGLFRLSAVSGFARAAVLCLFGAAFLAGCGGGGGGGGAFVSPSPPTCSSNELLIGSTCVTRKVCPAGQVLDETNNTCSNRIYWSQLQSHEYVSGVDSPHQQAFQAAGIGTGGDIRSGNAYLIAGGEQGRRVSGLLDRIGVSSFTYLNLDDDPAAVRTGDLVSRYAYLTSADFVNLSHSAFPFTTDADSTNSGISTSQVRQGAWMLLDTGSGGSQDPFQNLAQHYQDGVKAAATGGKLHFYYGLSASLTERHPSANGCKGIRDYCIGAPYEFQVELDGGSTVSLTGAPSSFAFATYLLAWERMPRTDISAVFDLALGCVEDIGASGADDDTGLGRLDIGCLAYEAAQTQECVSPKIRIGSQCQDITCPAGTEASADGENCTPVVYWSDIRNHSYQPGNKSAHQKAFEAAGFAAGGSIVDRSDDAYLIDGGEHGKSIQDLILRIGIPYANYTYRALSVSVNLDGATQFERGDLFFSYYPLASSDLVNLSVETFVVPNTTPATVGMQVRHLQDGAWVVQATSNDGQEDWLSSLDLARREGAKQAVATGKLHFYYGLDSTLASRHASSNGCKDIEEYCIGAPYAFLVQLRNNVLRNLSGTSFATPFGFAAYLLAWERMPERTHISAVFELALSCVEDIGDEGPDAATGRGRLDIGCMAYGATRAVECEPGYQLVSMVECEKFSYWNDMQNYFIINADETPLERAFKDVGLAPRVADRSTVALLIGSDNVRILVDHMNITATVNYQFVPVARTDYVSSVTVAYDRLGAASFLGLAYSFDVFTSNQVQQPGISATELAGGAWMVVPVGDSRDPAQVDPLAAVSTTSQAGVLQAVATGKVHFFYGLNDELSGRNSGNNDMLVDHTHESKNCRQIEEYCIGVPYTYFLTQPPSLRYLFGTSPAAAFGFATYLLTWERMPQAATIGDVFSLARSCTEDLGDAGFDSETGRGRLDIGCMAYGAYRANNPASATTSLPLGSEQNEDAESYMDDFAQGLFGDQLGFLSLPGPAEAKVQVGFAGDSFSGAYRPVQGEASYRGGFLAPRHLQLHSGFGLVASGRQVGAYYRAAPGLRAGVLAGRGESFFGGSGTGEFEFGCTTDLRLLLTAQVRPDADSRLGMNGWLGESRAGCIRGRLLDSLRGREAGLSAFYRRRVGSWQLEAQAWGSRFVGGEVGIAGQRFAIGASPSSHGGRVQVSYSF